MSKRKSPVTPRKSVPTEVLSPPDLQQAVDKKSPVQVDKTPAVAPTRPAMPLTNRPMVAIVGTAVWLLCQLMFFSGLFGIYFTARGVTPGAWPPEDVSLNPAFAVALTALLLLSSIACYFGVKGAARAEKLMFRRLYLTTAALGLAFVALQITQFVVLLERGLTPDSSAFAGVYYLVIGFHLFTVLGTTCALGLFLHGSRKPPLTSEVARRAVVLSYCWHFLIITWISILAVVYIIN